MNVLFRSDSGRRARIRPHHGNCRNEILIRVETLFNFFPLSLCFRSHSNSSESRGRGAFRVARQRIFPEALASTECLGGRHKPIVVEEWSEVHARHGAVGGQVHRRADDTTRVDSRQLWPVLHQTNSTCEIHCTRHLRGHHRQLTPDCHDATERHSGAARPAAAVKPALRYLSAFSALNNSARLAGAASFVSCRRRSRRTPAAPEDLCAAARVNEQQDSAEGSLHTRRRGWSVRC